MLFRGLNVIPVQIAAYQSEPTIKRWQAAILGSVNIDAWKQHRCFEFTKTFQIKYHSKGPNKSFDPISNYSWHFLVSLIEWYIVLNVEVKSKQQHKFQASMAVSGMAVYQPLSIGQFRKGNTETSNITIIFFYRDL